MRKFVISDTHAFHEKLAEVRGFKSAEKMTEKMAKAINSVVKPQDRLYHLGDFALGKLDNAIAFRQMLDVKQIVLVVGNHDYRKLRHEKFKELFHSIHELLIVKHNKKQFCFFHYPIESWPSRKHGVIHCHGHTHGKLKRKMANRHEVSIELTDKLKPFLLDDFNVVEPDTY